MYTTLLCTRYPSDLKSSFTTMIIPVRQAHKVPQSRPIESGTHCQAQIYTAYKSEGNHHPSWVPSKCFCRLSLALKPCLCFYVTITSVLQSSLGQRGQHLTPSELTPEISLMPPKLAEYQPPPAILSLTLLCSSSCRRHGMGSSECIHSVYMNM